MSSHPAVLARRADQLAERRAAGHDVDQDGSAEVKSLLRALPGTPSGQRLAEAFPEEAGEVAEDEYEAKERREARRTARAEEIALAIEPQPADVEMFIRATKGDEYAAGLCAKSDRAADAVLRRIHDARQGRITRDALDHWREVRDACRADVAQYYGEDLADTAPAVRRAAGYRL